MAFLPNKHENYIPNDTQNFRMQAIGMTTSWHEGHQKFEIWRKNKVNEGKMS